jgi:hypothetical protein
MFFRELLTLRWRAIRHSFAQNRTAKVLTIIGFVFALGVLVRIIYELFYFGFRYVARDSFFADALTLYIVELFLLISFALVALSALASGAFSLFRAPNDAFLMASPHHRARIGLVAGRMVATSLWPLLVVIFPALLALDRVFGLSFVGSLLSLISVLFLIILAVTLAILALFVAGSFLARFALFSVRRVAVSTGLIFAVLALFTWMRFRALDLVHFFQARMIDLSLPDLTPIVDQFCVFPSHLTALTIIHALADRHFSALLSLLVLGGMCVAALIVIIIVRPRYLLLWQKGEERHNDRTHATSVRPLATLLSSARSLRGALLKKEIVAFVRNTRGMFWLGFILFIWLIQVFASRVLVFGIASEPVAVGSTPAIVGILQFVSVLYFVAMFVLRFAFPSFSAERKTAWIIGMSPVDLRAVFRAKFAFFSLLFSLFALIFLVVNTRALGLPFVPELPMLGMILFGTVMLTLYGLALGAIFPNNETDDPERLGTTLPGIAFILGALALIGFSALALMTYLSTGNMRSLFGMVFVGSMIGVWCIALVERKLKVPTGNL